MDFQFDKTKNKKLIQERAISFEQVIEAIYNGNVLLDVAHPNQEKYPHQRLMIVEIDNYPYGVPYVKSEEYFFLKTIYPDRRYKKLLKERKERK